MSLKNWFLGLNPKTQDMLIRIDYLLGGFIWGDKPYRPKTISEHLAEEAKAKKLRGEIGCAVLDAIDPQHCDRADREGN